MKLALPAIFLFVIVQSVSAAIYEEQVFSEKLTSSGTHITSNGENFTVTLISDYISITLPGGSMIVKNNTCDNSGLYDVCLLINEFSHYNYTGPERIVNKRDVTVKTRVAKLNLTREIEKTEFWIGGETEVRMRVQNIGARPAAVSFLDNFSDSFEAAIPLNCDLKENAVVWKGELGANQVIACSYRIKAAKAGTFSSSATASYNNGVSEKTETDDFMLTVKDFPLRLSSNISGQKIELGSEVTAKFEINATENVTVRSLKMLLPEGLRLLGLEGIGRLDEKTLEYSGKLGSGDGREFTITFVAEKTGILPIAEKTKLVLTENMTGQSFEREIDANVSVEALYTRIANSNFSSGANKLDIFVVNPSKQDFYNVELLIETSLPLEKKETDFSRVSLLGHQDFSESFDAKPGTYPLTTTLTYRSIYGETFSVWKRENVTVAGEAEESVAEEQKAREGPETPLQEELPRREEPETQQEMRIKKGSFSARAAIFATAIVVILSGVIVAVSASRRKKYEDDEF